MAHKCAICLLVFGQYMLYQMHMEFDHAPKPLIQSAVGIKKPLTKAAKADIVRRGESRLGAYNFYGKEA